MGETTDRPESPNVWAMPDAWQWRLTDPTPLDHVVPARGFVRLWTPELRRRREPSTTDYRWTLQ